MLMLEANEEELFRKNIGNNGELAPCADLV
jgi:hypothetical protein